MNTVIGYCCVDSKEKHMFDEDRDVALGWMYVDVLTAVIMNAESKGELQPHEPNSLY